MQIIHNVYLTILLSDDEVFVKSGKSALMAGTLVATFENNIFFVQCNLLHFAILFHFLMADLPGSSATRINF